MQKVALIYDDLVQFGGGENFFKTICSIYPNADIFCPIVSKAWRKNLKIRYSKFLSFLIKFGKPGYYLASFLSIFWFESLKLNKYTTVISLCNRFSGVVITSSNTTHVCIHTYPFRALYKNSVNPLIGFLVRLYLFYALKRADINVAISNHTKLALFNYLGLRVDKVLYPPSQFTYSNNTNKAGDYFLIVGRCTKWKKPYFLKAIKLFADTKNNLVVVGDYYNKQGLVEKFSNYKNIKFVGRVSKKMLRAYYKNCIALIHPQVEDFGLTPLEALSYNKPVIYYNKGGVTEYLNSKVALKYNSISTLKKNLIKIKKFKFSSNEAKIIVNNHSEVNFKDNLNCLIKKTK